MKAKIIYNADTRCSVYYFHSKSNEWRWYGSTYSLDEARLIKKNIEEFGLEKEIE